ncbi:MAG: tRNA (adenosine(37)-N6)-dimethylallyltransferase MiaA [Albidovulum sp.]|nr:tRNA (adenosine(37)-N6)-dimethylallyltransferase MiaA [Albidovulum sp.]
MCNPTASDWKFLSSKRAVLLAGPTASGKSRLAMEIAMATGGTIVNADALQVYSCWRILTARPTADDEATAPHALYGHVARQDKYSVGNWLVEVERLLLQPDIAPLIVVGGTGLYFTALTEGFSYIPPLDPSVSRASADEMSKRGLEGLIRDLESNDPESLARIDPSNTARVRRAWEVWHGTGRGMAYWQSAPPMPLLRPADCKSIVLCLDRNLLARRIEERLEVMLELGLLEECRAALINWNPSLQSSQAIGAKQFIAHLNGELSLENAAELTAIATRQFAKRQRTWFRNRMKHWAWLEVE